MPGMNESAYRNLQTGQIGSQRIDDARQTGSSETILSITEDSVKAMEELNSCLNQISIRLAGSVSPAGNLGGATDPEPTMQRRAQFLRGLIHQALAQAQRIDGNL